MTPPAAEHRAAHHRAGLWIGPACLCAGVLLGRTWLGPEGRIWSGPEPDAPVAADAHTGPPSFAGAVARARAGIVAVRAVIDAATAAADQPAVAAVTTVLGDVGVRQGSGFIVHPSGLVVTARHLIVRAGRIQLSLPGIGSRDAEVVGEDAVTDLAALRIVDPPPDLQALELGRSEDLRAGDWIVVVGNPYGLQQTVTAGVVSFVGRHLQHYDLRVTNDFLQFSAPVNPGSSGSPVLDSQGRVVGVTTQHANSAQGISFAIPSKTLKWVLEEMDASADGRVQRGYLGIQFETRGADEHGRRLPGARVVDVTEGEPAHRAGLRPGDLVLFVDGNRIADAGDLHDRITRARPGRKVRLLLERDGQVLAPVVVELGDVAHGVGPGYSTPPGNG